MLASKLVPVSISFALALLAMGCGATLAANPTPTFSAPPTPTIPASSLYVVKRGNVAETLDARGRVVSLSEQPLLFHMEGWIKTLKVRPGSQVEEGDLLVEIDVPFLEEGVEKARFELDNSLLSLKGLKAAQREGHELWIQRARLWEEYYQIQKEAAITENQRKLVDVQKRIAKIDTSLRASELKQTENLIEKAQREVEYRQEVLLRAKDNLARTQLWAPFAGVVISLDKRLGDRVEPFETFGIIADPEQLEIEATVFEADISRIGLEQPANIVLDAFPLIELRGKVQHITSKPIIWQGKRAFSVNITFNEGQNVPRAIRMGADVVISTKLTANTLLVPTQAIYTDGSAKFVDVLVEGKPARVKIETGISNKEDTEVLAGLTEGTILRLP